MVLYADFFEADTRTLMAMSQITLVDLRHEQVDRAKHDEENKATATEAQG